VLLELLTGRRLSELLPNASIDLPTRVRELLRVSALGLSAPSIDLIGAAMEFHPSDRPQSASDYANRLSDDLEQIRSGPTA
jgi:hypothetical protein